MQIFNFLNLKLTIVEARKTYKVKENIQEGKIYVVRPQVQASYVEWCFFKNPNNNWCIQLLESLKATSANTYTYQATDLATL